MNRINISLFLSFTMTFIFNFQVSILNDIDASPTQLNANIWDSMRSLELLYEAFSLFPIVSTLIYLLSFKIQPHNHYSFGLTSSQAMLLDLAVGIEVKYKEQLPYYVM